MMWIISKEFTFEASHRLPFHDGKCQRLHGHSWKCFVYLRSDSLVLEGNKQGMVMDFADLKREFKPLLDEYLDHYHLNDTLGIESPTSENVARWIYERISETVPQLVAVRVDETCTSRCTYFGQIDPSDGNVMGFIAL